MNGLGLFARGYVVWEFFVARIVHSDTIVRKMGANLNLYD